MTEIFKIIYIYELSSLSIIVILMLCLIYIERETDIDIDIDIYQRRQWHPTPVWEDPLEEGMAIHSGILAWRILWTEEPGRLQSMGSLGVGHD